MSPFLHDQAPIGPRCCLAHSGLREEDESGGCDFRDDDSVDDCEFVDLYPGTEVVDIYHDDTNDDEEDD